MQIAAELRDNHWLARRKLGQTRVGFAQLEAQAFCSIARHRCNWPVGAERDPVAIAFAWEIIFETVPFSLRLIEPVHVPDPLQVVGPFRAHEIDNMAIRRDVASRAFSGTTVPFAVPTKPFPVWFHSPFDQNRRAKIFRIPGPDAKIEIELASDDFLKRK